MVWRVTSPLALILISGTTLNRSQTFQSRDTLTFIPTGFTPGSKRHLLPTEFAFGCTCAVSTTQQTFISTGCSSMARKIFFLTNLNRPEQSFEECSCETLLISLNWLISATERRTLWRFSSTRQIQLGHPAITEEIPKTLTSEKTSQ